jgi:biotin synthase
MSVVVESNQNEVLQDAVAAAQPKNSWSKEEIAAIYHRPLMDLTYQAVRYAPSM